MMIAARNAVAPSVSEGPGPVGAESDADCPPRPLANARDDKKATSHGNAVYLHEMAQPRAQAPAATSPRDQRSYDTSSNPSTAHSLHAHPAMIINAGVNASAIAAHSPPMRRNTASTAR